MSSDNFYHVDHHPTREGKQWSVTMGFMSDESNPPIKWNTAWFDNAGEAIEYAQSEYSEYGVVMSKKAVRAAWPDASDAEVSLGS